MTSFDAAKRLRILRQHVQTDQLLGVEAVPVGQAADQPPLPSTAPDVGRLGRDAKIQILEAIDRDEVQACDKCELCHSRTRTVFGEGDPDAPIMFVGEGPGMNEDQQGRPFVGRAGELLNKMIAAMGFERQQVYIANIVKCRPPENRTPTPAEAMTCWDYLRRQIQTIQPRVIVAVGGPAAKMLLDTTVGITALRGTWQAIDGLGPGGAAIPVMPTFHPAYLLRQYTPDNRAKVWSDLQQVMTLLQD